jgi:hypothetical protein
LGGSGLAITPPPSFVPQPPFSGSPSQLGYYGSLYGGYYGAFGGGAFGFGGGFGFGPGWGGFYSGGFFFWGQPGPPPKDDTADVEVSDYAFLALGRIVGWADFQVHDKAKINLGLHLLAQEHVVFMDFAFRASDIVRVLDGAQVHIGPPVPPAPNATRDRIAVWDQAFLAVGPGVLNLDRLHLRSQAIIGLAQHQQVKDRSGLLDQCFLATGSPNCYGDWEVLDYATIQLHTPIPPSANPIQVLTEAQVLTGIGRMVFDTVRFVPQAQARSQPTITERPPVILGASDKAIVAISRPILAVESLLVSEAASSKPGTQNITGNVIRPVDQLILGFPQPWGQPSDTPKVSDAVSVTVG